MVLCGLKYPLFKVFMHAGNTGVPSVAAWLAKELPSGSKVGFDATLTPELTYKQYSEVSLVM